MPVLKEREDPLRHAARATSPGSPGEESKKKTAPLRSRLVGIMMPNNLSLAEDDEFLGGHVDLGGAFGAKG